MPRIAIERRPYRRALFIARKGTKAMPSLIFPLDGVDRGELDELIRGILAKQGVTDEAEIQAIIDKAEQDSEVRLKIAEVKAEVSRLLAIRFAGGKLMQAGYRKWRQAFYPTVHRLKKPI